MILTLEEAIAREEDIVASNERYCAVAPSESAEAYHSATYHRQIAEWLKELAGRKPGNGKWIKGGYCCGETEWICPRCNASEWRTNRVPFCPWCGNPMEVDE